MTLIRLNAGATLHHADCRDALKTLPDNSIDSVVTDPPYALVSIVKRFGKPGSAPAKGNDAYMRASRGFMSARWDVGDVAFSEEFWSEVFRVLKPGGHVAAFGGTRTQHRLVCAIEDAGFEIRDQLYWHYGSGFPKSQNVSAFIDKELGAERTEIIGKSARHGGGIVGAGTSYEMNPAVPMLYAPVTPEAKKFDGFGTSLKPATEPIVLARKPLSEGTVAANVLRWGTGALNIGACRVGTSENTARQSGVNSGVYGRDDRANIRGGSELGRWPANVVHDGSDEVVGAFPAAGGQQGRAKIGGAKGGSIYGKFAENVTTNPDPRGDSGSAARFFYSAKASKVDRNGSKHPTVKPIALMQWLARLITPPGGTVLDPFAGSGTTGAAAEREGFGVVLCEREDEYIRDIQARFNTAPSPLSRLLRWNAAVSSYRARVAA